MLPIIIAKNRTDEKLNWWRETFESKKGYERFVYNWRRSQLRENRVLSDWHSSEDSRRILTYAYHNISLKSGDLRLHGFLLHLIFTYPKAELDDFESRIFNTGRNFGWRKIDRCLERERINISMTRYNRHFQDEIDGRDYPDGYESLDFMLTVGNISETDCQRAISTPWSVYRTGNRKADKKGKPKRIKAVESILQYLPAQIEFGSGVSTEAGISPLHELHRIYNIGNPKSKKFILNLNEYHLIDSILRSPMAFLKSSADIYQQIFNAKPTPLHNTMKNLFKIGALTGKIITNNFDGLIDRIGLNEKYIRKFKECLQPDVSFEKDAKSLLVIGSHADRRGIQRKARKAGKKIIFVDPEWFGGRYGFEYPLEAPQDTDFVWNTTATNFTAKMSEYFEIRNLNPTFSKA